ncbi:diacylglycerol/lipid kinase family protein [Candidatus Poriferisocius sp.]|uniref:diacylglycerol/lipid kinase family protein n=1 Tax=Candidatus Poriferisocius sp. TaxID=3101276 RepID=UPI003B5A0187
MGLNVHLVVNPHASSVTARVQVVIQKALAADHEVTLATTHRRGHASRLANGAVAAGADVVAVLGGDGTLNEAINGLAGSDVALAPLPGGSTNVFARSIGLPDDPVEAAAMLLETLADGNFRRIGLGEVSGRYFLFHAGVGYDAAVVQQVERRAGLKRYANHALFAFAAVDTWLRHYDRSRPRFTVYHADGETVSGQFAICLNTDPYTYLGARPFNVAPGTSLDGPLSLVTLRSLRAARLLRVAAGALGFGPPVSSFRHVHSRAEVTHAIIAADAPFPYQLDGDYLGETTRLEFHHAPDTLTLALPIT